MHMLCHAPAEHARKDHDGQVQQGIEIHWYLPSPSTYEIGTVKRMPAVRLIQSSRYLIDDAADRAHLLTVQHHKDHLVFLVRRVHQHPQGAEEPKLVVRLELLRHAAAVQNGRAGDMFLLQRREKLIQTFQLVQNDHQ